MSATSSPNIFILDESVVKNIPFELIRNPQLPYTSFQYFPKDKTFLLCMFSTKLQDVEEALVRIQNSLHLNGKLEADDWIGRNYIKVDARDIDRTYDILNCLLSECAAIRFTIWDKTEVCFGNWSGHRDEFETMLNPPFVGDKPGEISRLSQEFQLIKTVREWIDPANSYLQHIAKGFLYNSVPIYLTDFWSCQQGKDLAAELRLMFDYKDELPTTRNMNEAIEFYYRQKSSI